jgi:hypothetical protein
MCGSAVIVATVGSKKPLKQQLREREKLLRDYEVIKTLMKEKRNDAD